MQVHTVEHLYPHLETKSRRQCFKSTFLPVPHGAILSSCIFSDERLCCLQSVLSNWHYIKLVCTQSHMFHRLLTQVEIKRKSLTLCFLAQTYNTDTQTPDSAGTATAMFSGVKTRAGMLGLDGTAAYNVCAPASIQVTQRELRDG